MDAEKHEDIRDVARYMGLETRMMNAEKKRKRGVGGREEEERARRRSRQLKKRSEGRCTGLGGVSLGEDSIMNNQVGDSLSVLGMVNVHVIHTHLLATMKRCWEKSERGTIPEPGIVPSSETIFFIMCSLSSIAHPSVCAHTHRHARGESTTQLLKIGSCCSVLLSIPHSGCHFDSVSLGHIWLAGYQRTCGGMEGCYKKDHKNTSRPSAK